MSKILACVLLFHCKITPPPAELQETSVYWKKKKQDLKTVKVTIVGPYSTVV